MTGGEQRFFRLEPGLEGVLALRGLWRVYDAQVIAAELDRAALSGVRSLNGRELQSIDTSGWTLLLRKLLDSGADIKKLELKEFSAGQLELYRMAEQNIGAPVEFKPPARFGPLGDLGLGTVEALEKLLALLSFIGETHFAVFDALRRPKRFRFKELVTQLELVFFDAIPVSSLVTLLIGVVIAYLFATQIEQYGASIFIVDGVATAMCRELSPIIVAIIVAGRSGSAFTAQLGTMKLNEEIDALKTLGLSPLQVLVLPRLFALVIAMPLLVFLGDIVGIGGGAIIADLRLGITLPTFIERLHGILPMHTFMVGIVKAPVFAAFVAIIGCRMGFAVENNARSVGINTTSTVVQSIVSVILLNAAFAVIFVELGV